MEEKMNDEKFKDISERLVEQLGEMIASGKLLGNPVTVKEQEIFEITTAEFELENGLRVTGIKHQGGPLPANTNVTIDQSETGEDKDTWLNYLEHGIVCHERYQNNKQ